MTHARLVWRGCVVVGLLLMLTLAGCNNDKDVDTNVTVANLNILHGFACNPPMPAAGNQCRVEDRIALLVQHLDAAGCPDIVTLQEHVTNEVVELSPGVTVGPLANTVTLLTEQLPTLAATCDFTYEIVFDPDGATVPPTALGRGIDEEVILSRYPVLDAEVLALYSPLSPAFFRHVLFARIDHPQGPVDVFTTHLAAAADSGTLPCGVQLPPPLMSPPCPAECAAFVDTVRECQAKQMAGFVEMRHDTPNPALVTGDFNTEPFTKAYNVFADRGWLDSHLAANNAECDPVSGVNCTSGRDDQSLSDLEARELNQNRRIDFIFVVPATAGARCAGVIEPMSTGLFGAVPNPFVNECGPLPDAICWPSDHSGTQAMLACK